MRHKCWGLNLDSENGVMKKQSKAKAMVSNWRVPINKLEKLRICVKPGTLQKYSLEKIGLLSSKGSLEGGASKSHFQKQVSWAT